MRRIPFLLALMALPAPAWAQFDNPEDKIQEISQQIADDLAEIDRLLLETGAASKVREAGETMQRTVERMDELLEQTIDSQTAATERIDQLIKELEKLPGT